MLTSVGFQGGYGESHGLDDYLREQERLLYWKARHDEDAVQEARIAVWQTLARHPDATRSYLDQAATWRIRAVLRGEALTGESRPRGRRGPDPLRAYHESDDVLGELAGVSHLDGVESAYHHGELMKSIAELPLAYREYVVLRFWGGMDRNEIAARLHRTPANLATTWRTMIKPRLADRLSHLN